MSKLTGFLIKSLILNNFCYQQEELEDGSIVNDAAAFGHTGIFAKDAPRVCGGKNHKGKFS